MRKARLALFLLSFISFILPVSLFAQVSEVDGTVRDSQKAAIHNAEVRIVQQAQGTTRTVRTNDAGAFVVPFLIPGPYRIYVQAPSFSTAVSDVVNLTVGQTFVFNVVLKVGNVSEQVNVQSGSDTINTTDGAVSSVIGQELIANLPLNGRSLQDLMALTPGVVTQNPDQGGLRGNQGDFSVNGQRTESNYYTVDGVSGNLGTGIGLGPDNSAGGGIGGSTALGTTQSLVPVDALQEFRVESSTYSAEYGRSPGGQFVFVTKSGTNAYHGDVFDYFRNNYFDSNDWFNDYTNPPTPIPALRQNDFGGSVGGPVRIPHLYDGKDKSFFFFVYEGLRLVQPQPINLGAYVPDLAFRQAAAPVLQPFLNAFPLPTPGGKDNGNGLQQVIVSYSEPARIDTISFRIDQVITPKNTVFFKFQDSPSNQQSRSPNELSSLSEMATSAHSYTFGATSQIHTNLSNELRLLYFRGSSTSSSKLDGFGGATPIDAGAAAGAGGYPDASVDFDLILNPFISLYTHRANNGKREWNAVDTLSWSHGHHQFKFGVDFARISVPYAEENPIIEAVYYSPAQVVANSASFGGVTDYGNADPVYTQTSVFAQDNWRIAPRLSLSLGLRWELDPPPYGGDGNDAYTARGTPGGADETLAPRGTPLWKTTKFNFAPRVGAAWQVHQKPGQETVVRGGFGVFFDTDDEYAALDFESTGFSSGVFVPNFSLPVPASDLTLPLAAAPPYSAIEFPEHLQLPYTLEWNAALQQSLGKEQSLTLSYVGSNGRRLFGEQFFIGGANPDFASTTAYTSGITSNYQALQTQFQRTVAHGLTAFAAYTWSHAIDFGSTPFPIAPQRGNSDFDLRHNLQIGSSWQLPDGSQNRLAGAILNHWGLDARLMSRSSMPVYLEGPEGILPNGQLLVNPLYTVPGQPMYLYGAQCTAYYASVQTGACPGGRSINPAALTATQGAGETTSPRNAFRGFGATQINLSARREFHLTEAARLQFRSDVFNILNHPIFGNIDQSYGDPTFGEANATLANSLTNVSSLYQQGGARSMQFSLKILF